MYIRFFFKNKGHDLTITCDSLYDHGVILVAPAACSIVCHAPNSRSLNSYFGGYIVRKVDPNSIMGFSDSPQFLKKFFQSAFAIVHLFT
jgi:hypothetical protein